MANNRITIDGNFNPFLKGIGKASAALQRLGRTKVSMGIDKKTMEAFDIIEKSSKRFPKFQMDAYKKLHESLMKYKGDLAEIKRLEETSMKVGSTPINSKIKEKQKILELTQKETLELRKQFQYYRQGNLLQRKGVEWQLKGGKKGGLLGGAQNLTGMAMEGVGSAISAMGPAGWAIGAGMGTYMLARALSAPRRQMAGMNMQLQGMNKGLTGQMLGIQNAGISSGIGPAETMQSALNLQKTAGNITAKDMSDFGFTKRMTGLGDEELAPVLQSFREAASTKGGAELGGGTGNIKKLQELYAQAMLSALDTSGALRYMETTASMTSSIATEGTPDIKAIQDSLSSLAASDEFYKSNAKRSEAAIKGTEDFYKSTQGTGIAMMAMQASGKFGGKGPGEMLLAQKMGFTQKPFKAGEFEYGGVGTEGLGLTVQSFAESTGLSKGAYAKAGPEERALAGRAIADQFGIGAENAMKLLDASMTDKLKEMSPKEIENLLATEKDKTNNLLGSIDGQILKNEARFENIMLNLGDRIVEFLAPIEGSVLEIADNLMKRTSGKSQRQLEFERVGLQEDYKKASENTLGNALWGSGDRAKRKLDENTRQIAYKKLSAGEDIGIEESLALSGEYNYQTFKDLDKMSPDKLKGVAKDFSAKNEIVQKRAAALTEQQNMISDPNQQKIFKKKAEEEMQVAAMFKDMMKTLMEQLNKKGVIDFNYGK